ncbi:unnamed protein product [Diamesa serratosioi]
MTFAIKVKYDTLTNSPTPGYSCSALDLVTTKPGTVITEFEGEHELDKGDEDVLIFDITKQKSDYLPRGLSARYVNMRVLHVMESGVKSIARDDFKAMPKLKEIALYNNNIENIPSNCFDDLVLLERLSLTKNKIKVLPTKVFHALPNLKAIYLSQNVLSAIPADLFEKNPKMEFIGFRENTLKLIGSDLLKNLKGLKEVNFKNNICINNGFPKTSIANLVKIFKSKCSIRVDTCAIEIANLLLEKKRINEEQKKYEAKKKILQRKCRRNPAINSFSTESILLETVAGSEDLKKKYEDLQEFIEILAESKDCNIKLPNGTSNIQLEFRYDS